ncbi:MAG: type II toxin-antitoxin system prevent-host-death family antitoxin [Acidobacteriota bacterium]
MPLTVTVAEAKTSFEELIKRVSSGEELVIVEDGEPQARLVPAPRAARRGPGGWEGQVQIADDFDEPLPEPLLAAFEGKT